MSWVFQSKLAESKAYFTTHNSESRTKDGTFILWPTLAHLRYLVERSERLYRIEEHASSEGFAILHEVALDTFKVNSSKKSYICRSLAVHSPFLRKPRSPLLQNVKLAFSKMYMLADGVGKVCVCGWYVGHFGFWSNCAVYDIHITHFIHLHTIKCIFLEKQFVKLFYSRVFTTGLSHKRTFMSAKRDWSDVHGFKKQKSVS